MRRYAPEIALALIGALFGVGASAIYDVLTERQSELSVRYTSLSSAIPGPRSTSEPEIPSLSIHRFSWKNTGNVGFKDLIIEFAPEGGDAAYDDSEKQELHIDRMARSDFGAKGVEVDRAGNVIRIKYERFPAGAIDNVTIDSPSLVERYSLAASDPDAKIRLEDVRTDFEEPATYIVTAERPSFFWPFVVTALISVVACLLLFFRALAGWRRRAR